MGRGGAGRADLDPPGEDRALPEPSRELVLALHELYCDAGKPSSREIAMEIRKGHYRDTVSHDTIAKMLRGHSVPRWDKWDAVVRALAVWNSQRRDPDTEARRMQELWLAAQDHANVSETPEDIVEASDITSCASRIPRGADETRSDPAVDASRLIREELAAYPSRSASPDDYRPVPRHGTRIGRRTVIIAMAGGLLAAAKWLPNTSATSGSAASVPSRSPAWKFATGYAMDCTPAAANSCMYVGNDSGAVYALHATGDLRWIATTGHSQIFGCLVVVGRILYVGSNSRRGLYALDTTNGGILWHHPTGAGVRSGITAADGNVYFSSMDNNVYAAEANTGKHVWRFATKGSVQSTPAIAHGILYVGSSDYYLYALDASSGHFKWKSLTGGYISSSPTVVGGTVYVGSGDHHVYALHAATGSIKWAYPTGGPIYFSSPAVANGILYIGSTDGKVYALDAASGRKCWVRTLSGKKILSSPVVSAGTVYIGSYDGKVYALDAATGGILWAYSTGHAITRSAAVADGLVYIGSDDGNLYAFSTAPHQNYDSPATPMAGVTSSARQ